MRLTVKVTLGFIFGFGCTVLVIYFEIASSNVTTVTTPPPTTATILTAKLYLKSYDDYRSTGSFQRLQQNAYIYSAFIDDHHQVIRLIVLTGRYYQPKIVCHYCSDDDKSCECPPRLAQYYTSNENHGRQYGGFIVSCRLPSCQFNSYHVRVSVEGQTTKPVQIPLISTTPTIALKHEYSICIPPLRGEGTEFLYQLTEFIEVSLKLGASFFTFYNYKTDKAIQRLLSYYEKQGLARILLWDVPSHMTRNVNQLWYYGQVLAIQDCLYRNKATSKFVAFNDIDEYIVPLKHSTVPLLLQDIHTAKHCGYCFDSVIFSLNARIPGIPRNIKKSKLRTLRIQYRTSKTVPSWSKCIVDPQQVFEMGIHHVSKSTNHQVTAVRLSDHGLVFHYRKCSSAYGLGNVCGDLVADDSINRFTTNLQHRVDKVITHIQET